MSSVDEPQPLIYRIEALGITGALSLREDDEEEEDETGA